MFNAIVEVLLDIDKFDPSLIWRKRTITLRIVSCITNFTRCTTQNARKDEGADLNGQKNETNHYDDLAGRLHHTRNAVEAVRLKL